MNNDGYLDLLLSDADLVCKVNPWPWTPGYGRVYHFQGGANNTLSKVGFIKDTDDNIIDIGDCSTPILTDWNNDGLLDLLLGTYGPHDESNALFYEWRIYLNSGTKEQYAFLNYTTLSDKQGNAILATTLLIRDFDSDGKNDIVFALNNDVIMGWYKNVGSKENPQFENFEDIDIPTGITFNFEYFELADITGDNILDLIYVNMYYPNFCKGISSTNTGSNLKHNSKSDWKINNRNKKINIEFQASKYIGSSILIYNCLGKLITRYKVKENSISIKMPVSGWYTIAVKSKKSFQRKSLLIP